ncbi:Gaa1-like protein [Gymnopilus junonius]|uniref:Gaa1-like protein n=1 Tax=Gymnopilus junonius TaxID=109634 RepID=A0A9P5P1V1_GYMJU|nr:Gaa1-like protein [Gymnopilus junonius]
MDEPVDTHPGWRRVVLKFKGFLRPSGNIHEKRIRRRMASVDLLNRRLPFMKIALFFVGYLWMAIIPLPDLSRNTYIDENALQPAQVNTEWSWADVHVADQYLAQLEQIRDANYSSEQKAYWLSEEFGKHGLSSSTQSYSFSTSISTLNGTNSYAIISAPRHSGTEAIVISASWISRTGDGDGTLNLRGISTILALAGFLKRYSYWGKDIILVVSDGYLQGMQAWLGSYHGVSQPGLTAEPLKLSSGVIWTALNIDYPGHSFSHLGVFFEGLNGRLPNQDLINSLDRISRYTAGVPMVLYDHLDPRENISADQAPSWMPQSLYGIPEIKAFLFHARNTIRHLGYQVNGRGSGVHGLFHQFRIDAVTLFAVPATGPHGFHAIGKTIESTLRTMNNLLERLHASFFFYILTGPQHFLKIGLYLPSAILISVAIMFHGLSTWVDASWVQETGQKSNKAFLENHLPLDQGTKWTRRQRPVIGALCIMAATHLYGFFLFNLLSSSLFSSNYKSLSPLVFFIFSFIPLAALWIPRTTRADSAPIASILKACNLCFTSTIISVTTVINFALAASLAALLGIPLTVSSSSSSLPLKLLKYACYAFLSLGWLLLAQGEMMKSFWYWEILQVWFAPFVCIVYVPLVVQAGITCLLYTQNCVPSVGIQIYQ